MEETLSSKTIAYFVKDKLDYTIKGLSDYIKENGSESDIFNEKNSYIVVDPRVSINETVGSYLLSVLPKIENEDTKDLEEAVLENLDIFFDIDIDEDSTTVSIAEN